jgi:hypothetical protein
MPRRQREKYPLLVSERDRQIYHEVAVAQRTQRDVAAEFKLSQPRVLKIVERVFQWMCETAPTGFAEVPRPQRLYGVARTYKQKLEYYEREANEVWQRSKKETLWTRTHDVIEDDGEKKLAPGKVTQKNPKPEIKYLQAAEKFASKLAHFEGFEENGSVARNNDDRLHEVPPILPEQELDVWIRNGELAAKMKREREQERVAALAAVAPSPLYSGERVGVRGEAPIDSNHSQDSLCCTDDVDSETESVPAPAPHPSPLPGVPRRGDRNSDPSAAVLSNDSAETRLDRENVGPNEFCAGLSNAGAGSPTNVSPRSGSREAAGTEYQVQRTGYQVPSDSHQTPSPPYSVPSTPYSVLTSATSTPAPQSGALRRGDYIVNSDGLVVPRPKPQKVYPPTSEGYWRFGDVCRPKMTRRPPIDWTKVRPGQPVKPPRYYQLSEDGKKWLGVW